MSIKKTMAAVALGALIGACVVEGNHKAGDLIAKSKTAIKDKIDDLKSNSSEQQV